MPRTKGSKTKKVIKKVVKTQSQKQSQTVHVHIEKPKTRKKRNSKPKEQSTPLLKSSNSVSSSVSSGLIHTRGQLNNEQPTIIQQIQAPPDPRIDKLEKRSLKIKAYLKGNKGESKTNPINVESPLFQDAFETPSTNSRLVSEKNVEPRKINFEKVNFNTPEKPKSKYSLLSLFSRTPKEKKIEMTKRDSGTSPSDSFLTLEYKPSKPSATAPTFMETQTTTTEMQTTPIKTGTEIRRQLKNLVNQLHHSHPNSKMHMSTFRSAIAKKLKELGVESSHTDAYVKEMRLFYDELWKGSNEIMPA
jgi:hypothetical protein